RRHTRFSRDWSSDVCSSDLIIAHPSVAEVAVVGVPSERMGEEVIAVVVPAPGAMVTEAELLDYCHEHLAKYKTPCGVIFVEALRSEERRVGKGCRARWSAGD